MTCRYPFILPENAELNLLDLSGPLTAAETIKLAWALPRLDGSMMMTWRRSGGSSATPRTLEYLDALR